MKHNHQTFSQTLTNWLSDKHKKTIGSMLDAFGEKSFAFIFLILMIFPAIPLPTGGITHVFEVIVILLATQLVIGRKDLWLPAKLQQIELGRATRKKILPFLVRRIQFFEKFSQSRLPGTIKQKWFRAQLGVVVIIFTLGAFLAPPFTGLDTLPSLGVVLIAIGVILDDMAIIAAGYVVGVVGLSVAVVLGVGIVAAINSFF